MKKLMTVLMIAILAGGLLGYNLMGCASQGKLTPQVGQVLTNVVTKAEQALAVVQAMLPGLEQLVKLPDFVDKAKPYLVMAQAAEASIKAFIAAHTAGQPVTTQEQAALDQTINQVTTAQPTVTDLQTQAVKTLKSDNDKLKGANLQLIIRNDMLNDTLRKVKVK